MSYLKDVLGSRELMINLAVREIKGKYKKTILGQLWSLANPLALMLVYTFVFAFVFRVTPGPGNPSGLHSFPLWLLAGLLPWLFFARALSTGVQSLVANESLIQKVYFARVVLPISDVVAIGYNWLFEMLVLLAALFIAGAQIWTTLPYLIVIIVLLFLFAVGLSLILSIVNVYFRDTEHLIAIALQLWMYLSPVVYPISLVQSQSEKIGPLFNTNVTLLDLYSLNPMAQFMTVFRTVLYDVTSPSLLSLLVCAIWSFAALSIGVFVYSKKDKNLAEAL
ncbi:lipopolysaccharide transport system permease protein [Aurantimicrobium minutum]|uniref:ABC transporter permease n=1 Tax=Aurantimicrobium minutum TaxID=708131 RepID=UPI002474F44E|nr:ABC transporter permease [Aurantimicrobium minutum]MDH6409546.1 lipopolysaccharide transport system permease protein [Aurantimicrobium minutum]